MKLRTKLLILITAVVCAAFSLTFYQTARFQNQLVLKSAERQAKMMAQQIILTRKWVADHNGLFFLKSPDAQPNPYLEQPEIRDIKGEIYVKRNPAMVTRELSQYADASELCRFKVTSLKPVNPLNSPDDFERKGLEFFEQGGVEAIKIEHLKTGSNFRYMIPLVVESSCLECHAKHGYSLGNIRGGLSLSIPVDWAFNEIRGNNIFLLTIGVLSILVVCFVIVVIFDRFVGRRLASLAIAMDRSPEDALQYSTKKIKNDEIGFLEVKFAELGQRSAHYQKELQRTQSKMFQAEKMASLGRLTAGIAHEINNPLGGMRNCVQSMKKNPEDSDMRTRYLDLLDSGLVRIKNTLSQLLNFGRQEPLKLQSINIDQVIEECLALLEYRLKNISLSKELNVKQDIVIDVEAFKQVIVNFCLNACQAMPDGGSLRIVSQQKQDTLLVEVHDTGSGISPANINKIFDPFFTTKEVGEGTGLGLTVSFTLIQRMGGSIVVESSVGQGSCFKIELPLSYRNNSTNN